MQTLDPFQGTEIHLETGDVLHQITNITAPAFNYQISEICTSRLKHLFIVRYLT
jgi:hypothetical protein